MIIKSAARLSNVSEYYFSRKLKEIAELNNSGFDIINLGIGSPDLPPSPEVIAELQKYAERNEVHGYQSYVGLPELRQEIAAWMKSNNDVDLDPANDILPLIGSKEGIMHISMAFLDPGDKVLIPDPGYPTYMAVAELVQAKVIKYELDEEDDWNIHWRSFEKLPLADVKLMWLNYPNMPTGVRGNNQQLKRLISLAKRHNFLLINDNPYSCLHDGQPFSIFQIEGAAEVCLELNSLSKSHNMAGWRLGWVSGQADYIKTILRVKSNMDSGMFQPIQKAAVKALQLPMEWYSSLNETYKNRRIRAFEIMEVLGCSFDQRQRGLFVWAKSPEHIADIEKWVDLIIQEAGVFITPGFIFGSKGDRYLRISLCSSEELLAESLDRIMKSLEKLRP
ncbi:MAG: aminotransferase class I/II-fold pyridoxal phosphate-dependent enzyme [Bacteroidota bacterium]